MNTFLMIFGVYCALCILGVVFNWWADKSLENDSPTMDEWNELQKKFHS
tara:strand:+ start:433 stop:579 length:147 start_codon:yes stop_codon:yes gene_type:complete